MNQSAPDPQRTTFDRAQAGEPVLDDLIEDHLPRLRAYVRAHMDPALRRRETSVDLVQSVCRVLLGERQRFDFEGEVQFRAWLFTSALNKIREKHRFHHVGKRDFRREDAACEPDAALAIGYQTVRTPSQIAAGAEEVARLEAALDALSEDHREVIALARLAELPLTVIAKQMERSEDAVRVLLGRALIKLGAEIRRLESGGP